MEFKTWLENKDIFGFDIEERIKSTKEEKTDPIKHFNIEQVVNYLSNKKIGVFNPKINFVNEIQWGERFGAVKLEIDTGFRFFVKQLVTDLEGNKCWITKNSFQLDRSGVGGQEDPVANEIFEYLQTASEGAVDAPSKDYDLPKLVHRTAAKMRNVAESKFLFQGITKIQENNYQIIFGVGGMGLEARNHRRVEQNVTDISYNENAGVIRISNYNVQSKVGGPHSWTVMPVDSNHYFLPSQSLDEISEIVAVHFKYY